MKLKTKIVALASTALLFVGAAFGVGISLSNANAEEWTASATEWQWEDSYLFGSTLDIPAYTVTVGGESLATNAVVTYPNGTTTTETSLSLEQAGVYTVSYYASKGGKEYVKTVTFEVGYKAYYVTSERSSVEYGEYTNYGAEYQAHTNKGLLVRLANGDKLEFAHLIDVKELTAKKSLMTGFITPDAFNVADFDKFIVTLTDSKDPSIYLQIDINRWTLFAGPSDGGKATTFVSAGGNGQDMVGYEEGKGLHVNDNVGTALTGTFVAAEYKHANGSVGAYWSGVEVVNVAPNKYPLSVSYDSGLNSVFASGSLVSDLDSSEYYETLWNGFPSGKVRISFSGAGYQAATANFCLTSVYGVENLANESFSEQDPPVITVNTEYTTMPNAKIGTAYKVPTATAYDEYSGACEVQTNVWYNYASQQPVSVSMKDGTFVPTRNGHYSIVYTATDNFGHTATEVYSVLAVNEIPELTVECPASVPTVATLGYPVEIERPTIAGGTGNVTCVVTATGPDGSYEVTDSVIPDVAGKWTITYTVTDYIGTTATNSFEFEASAGDKPVIYDTLVLPKVFLNDVSYVLPEIYADDYSSGRKVSALCDVKIEYGDKTEMKKAGDTFVPSVAENGDKIKITYFNGNAQLETREVPTVIVKEGMKIYVKNYVYGEGITVTDKDENNKNLNALQITANQSGDVSWTFANPQVAELFTMKLSSLEKKTMFDSIQITLTDTENADEKVTLTLGIKSATVIVSNGSFETTVDMSLMQKTIFNVSYSGGRFKFEKVNVDVETYDNGEAFNGFSSNKVYATVTTTGTAVGAAYLLMDVSGSATTHRTADYAAPSFAILGDSGGSYSIGSTYELAPAIANDTFAPKTSLTVTVFDPNGEIISDVNGLKMENVDASKSYTIKLDSYGLYNIQYLAAEVEWVDNSDEFINYVNVIDEIAPVITLTSEYTTTAKVGDVIVLPNFTVSDNLSDSTKIVVDRFIQNPTGRLVRIPASSNSVKATYAGTYIFRILVKDEYGNSTTMTLKVLVTE